MPSRIVQCSPTRAVVQHTLAAGGDAGAGADVAILVDDRAVDDCAGADADRRPAFGAIGGELAGRFVVVGAHDHGVANRDVAADAAAQTDDAVFDARAGADHAAIGDKAALDRDAVGARRRQRAGAGVDGRGGRGELERRVRLGEHQVRFVERADGADVFPVAVEQVELDVAAADRGGEDLAAEVVVVGFLEGVDERLAVEEIDAHAGEAIAAVAVDAVGVDPGRVGFDQCRARPTVCGFSRKPTTRPSSSTRMMPRPEAAARPTGLAAIVTSACATCDGWRACRGSPCDRADRRRGSGRRWRPPSSR